MEYICPLCNGLRELNATCTKCGTLYQDHGMVTDYVGAYSPYELTPQLNQFSHQCVHILFCPSCGKESYAIIQNDVK